ncbi:hypothetical protein FB451DRAFT_1369805 [Mycena latifolia]|nr:hypothetical protein FB451DRAFT_1369805 [Mycena latifolia]
MPENSLHLTGSELRSRLVEIELGSSGNGRARVTTGAPTRFDRLSYPRAAAGITSEILIHSVDNPSCHPMHIPLRLASVCQAWRAIMIALSPCALWAVFDPKAFHSGDLGMEVSRESQEAVLSILAQFSSQLRSINILQSPFLSLKKISFDGEEWWDDDDCTRAFLDAPQLLEARITHLSLAQISPWIQLAHLELSGQSLVHSDSSLLGYMALPALERLEPWERSPHGNARVTSLIARWGYSVQTLNLRRTTYHGAEGVAELKSFRLSMQDTFENMQVKPANPQFACSRTQVGHAFGRWTWNLLEELARHELTARAAVGQMVFLRRGSDPRVARNSEVCRGICELLGELANQKSTAAAFLASTACAQLVSPKGPNLGIVERVTVTLSLITISPEVARAVNNVNVSACAVELHKSRHSGIKIWTCELFARLAWYKSSRAALLREKPCRQLVSLLRDHDQVVIETAAKALSIISRSAEGQ